MKVRALRNIGINQIVKDAVYIVICISVTLDSPYEVFYRVLGDTGIPALYEAKDFKVVSTQLKNFSIWIDNSACCNIIPNEIFISPWMKNNDQNDFWEAFFTESNVSAKKLMKCVAERLAKEENISIPNVTNR